MTKHQSVRTAKHTKPRSYKMKGRGQEEEYGDPGLPAGMRLPGFAKPTTEYGRGMNLLGDMRGSPYADPDSDAAKHQVWKTAYTAMQQLHAKINTSTPEERKVLIQNMITLMMNYAKTARGQASGARPQGSGRGKTYRKRV